MTRYLQSDELQWTDVDVFGATMSKASVFEGNYDVRSGFFRMPAGCAVPPHHHEKWVQVVVLEGSMRIEQKGEPDREVAAGSCYFVEAGETHVETAVEDTLVLVTQGEDRPAHRSEPYLVAGPAVFEPKKSQLRSPTDSAGSTTDTSPK